MAMAPVPGNGSAVPAGTPPTGSDGSDTGATNQTSGSTNGSTGSTDSQVQSSNNTNGNNGSTGSTDNSYLDQIVANANDAAGTDVPPADDTGDSVPTSNGSDDASSWLEQNSKSPYASSAALLGEDGAPLAPLFTPTLTAPSTAENARQDARREAKREKQDGDKKFMQDVLNPLRNLGDILGGKRKGSGAGNQQNGQNSSQSQQPATQPKPQSAAPVVEDAPLDPLMELALMGDGEVDLPPMPQTTPASPQNLPAGTRVRGVLPQQPNQQANSAAPHAEAKPKGEAGDPSNPTAPVADPQEPVLNNTSEPQSNNNGDQDAQGDKQNNAVAQDNAQQLDPQSQLKKAHEALHAQVPAEVRQARLKDAEDRKNRVALLKGYGLKACLSRNAKPGEMGEDAVPAGAVVVYSQTCQQDYDDLLGGGNNAQCGVVFFGMGLNADGTQRAANGVTENPANVRTAELLDNPEEGQRSWSATQRGTSRAVAMGTDEAYMERTMRPGTVPLAPQGSLPQGANGEKKFNPVNMFMSWLQSIHVNQRPM